MKQDMAPKQNVDQRTFKSDMLEIDGIKVYHEIHGTGRSAVLLIHGAVGSTRDFDHQLRQGGLDLKEFTVVTADLPGYGRSTPPVRDFKKKDIHEKDADCMMKLMQHLKFRTYSVAGWDEGARTAAWMAIKYPGRVDCLIVWGFTPHMDDKACRAIGRTRDVELFDPLALDYYASVYGVDEFNNKWHEYVDAVVSLMQRRKRPDMRDELSQIKCPTLIVHGAVDPIIDYNLHIRTIEQKVPDSRVAIMDFASHNLHQAHSTRFNDIMSTFIISTRA